jgi:hypothetical protein
MTFIIDNKIEITNIFIRNFSFIRFQKWDTRNDIELKSKNIKFWHTDKQMDSILQYVCTDNLVIFKYGKIWNVGSFTVWVQKIKNFNSHINLALHQVKVIIWSCYITWSSMIMTEDYCINWGWPWVNPMSLPMIATKGRRRKQSLFILLLPDYHSDNRRKHRAKVENQSTVNCEVLFENKIIKVSDG